MQRWMRMHKCSQKLRQNRRKHVTLQSKKCKRVAPSSVCVSDRYIISGDKRTVRMILLVPSVVVEDSCMNSPSYAYGLAWPVAECANSIWLEVQILWLKSKKMPWCVVWDIWWTVSLCICFCSDVCTYMWQTMNGLRYKKSLNHDMQSAIR